MILLRVRISRIGQIDPRGQQIFGVESERERSARWQNFSGQAGRGEEHER